MTSLGFESVLIDNYTYDDVSLKQLFELLSPLGIRNFIFLFEFDFSENSFAVHFQKLKNFEARANKLLPRGFSAYAKSKLLLKEGCSFNKDFKRIFASKKHRALFSSYPIFSESFRYDLAKDINQILYRHKCFTLFTEFEKVAETSSVDTYSKLFGISNAAFGFDINYLLRPEKTAFVDSLIKNKVMLMPMITHDFSNYVGIARQAEYFIENSGKKKYYEMCRIFLRCASRLGF